MEKTACSNRQSKTTHQTTMSNTATILAATAMLAAASNSMFGSYGIGNRKNLIPNRSGLNQRQKRKNARRAIAAGLNK